MAYCRWSSDDNQCDVYVYEHVNGGWMTHVAGRRRIYREPLPEPVSPSADFNTWWARRETIWNMAHDWLDLPQSHAGATYHDDTPGECADRLEQIRADGFNVPQYAIDALRAEQAEMDALRGKDDR